MGVEQRAMSEIDATPMGRISGLAVDTQGSVFVADELASQVHLISSEGSLVASFARSGDGPGEVRRPCCLRLASTGELLVMSPAAQRVDVFQVTVLSRI
jgi:hypothetical protein